LAATERRDEEVFMKYEITKYAKSVESDHDLDGLIEVLKDKKVVMLGESTHGSAEFYAWRRIISKKLIERHGFSFIAVEGDWPACEKINQAIHVKKDEDPFTALSSFTRWPTWMWGNTEISALISDLRMVDRFSQYPVGFHGLDVYSLFESIDSILSKLSQMDRPLAASVKKYYSCLDPFRRDERAYARSLTRVPRGCQEEVMSALDEMLKRNIVNDRSNFDLVQNARVIRNAEHYYRSLITLEEDSWNIRDQHMLETLDNLLMHYGPDSKAIVWAHNSHVGDYRATSMINHGQINLGGLAREKYKKENVSLVGFTTFKGEVNASSSWDGPMEIMKIPEAAVGSFEENLHRGISEIENDKFYINFTDVPKDSYFYQVMGNRAIGVVYHPLHEYPGNYVPTIPARRYDSVFFIDETTSLVTLDINFTRNKIPDTYPYGDQI
jgi:erythromycin esterase